ncbi:hypothetical protein LJR289_000995 [Pseudoduganella sp. LjRoot289]|uniref:hypothetical protein n=1 Tax=Pseudoduganella sp. LjRoot289 TaxID=3342314 RepID=UPI003ECC2B76
MQLKAICALLSAALVTALSALSALAASYQWDTVRGITYARDPNNVSNVYLMAGTAFLNGGKAAIQCSRVDVHQYGGPGNGQFVAGDLNTYGTVYMTTAVQGSCTAG